MYCRKCGTEIPDDSAFCPKCGSAVAQENVLEKLESQPAPPTTAGVASMNNDDSGLSEIRELNKRIKSGEAGQKQRKRRKIVPVIITVTSVLAVMAAALIILLPQAGIGFEYERVQDYYKITQYTGNSQNVTIPDTIWFKPVAAIASNAFSMRNDKANAVNVKLGKNISQIHENAFKDYSSLKELDCSAVQIKSGCILLVKANAFENCTNLEKITFPHACINIESSAFKKCSSLEEIYTFDQHILYTSENQNFKATIGMFEDNGNPFEKNSIIGSQAFEGCTSLKNLSLINTRLEYNSFENCTGVTEIIMTGGNLGDIIDENLSLREKCLKRPGGGAFKGCTGLKTVELNFLEENSIPDSTFYGCTSLASVFGANISAIGDKAFGNCTSLSEVEFETNPSDISETAFIGCTKLEQESQPDEVPEVDEQQNTKKSKLAQSTITTGMGVTYKEFVSEYGMPDECYNGKAIYNVGNMQYCIVYGEYGDTFDPYSTDTNVTVEEYGDKNVIIFDEMHLGEDVSYYITMADKLGFDYESTQLQLGAGNHGATWYELKLYYSIYLELVLYFDPDTMTAYGVHGQFYW